MTMSKSEVLSLLGKRAKAAVKPRIFKNISDIAENPVKASAHIASPEERRKIIRINMEIDDGWYVYGKPLVFPYTVPLAVDISGSAIQEVLEINFPAPSQPPLITGGKSPSTIYTGSLKIEARILMKKTAPAQNKSDNGTIRVSLRYQPCSSEITLPPVHTSYRVAV